MRTPVLHVKARWGYSEIADSNFAHCYDGGHDIVALRRKRHEGVLFDDLSDENKYNLAFQCAVVRANLLPYFVGITEFDNRELSHQQLGDLLVPPIVWGGERYIKFLEYIATPTDASDDARRVRSPTQGYQPPIAPLTVGSYYAYPILVDGYHRATLFWKYGPENGTVPAFMPVSL
jgi:hypothetical protein